MKKEKSNVGIGLYILGCIGLLYGVDRIVHSTHNWSLLSGSDYRREGLVVQIIISLVLVCAMVYIRESAVKIERKIILTFFIMAICLGWIGYTDYMKANDVKSYLSAFYVSIQLLTLGFSELEEYSLILDVARFMAVFAVFGIAFIVFAKDVLNRFIIRVFYRNHVIIAIDHIDDYVAWFINSLNNGGQRVVVLHSDSVNIRKYVKINRIRVLSVEMISLRLLKSVNVDQALVFYGFYEDIYDNISMCEKIRSIKSGSGNGFILCYAYAKNFKSELIDYKIFKYIYEHFDARVLNPLDMCAEVIVNEALLTLFDELKTSADPEEKLKNLRIGFHGEGKLVDAIIRQNLMQSHIYPHDKQRFAIIGEGYKKASFDECWDMVDVESVDLNADTEISIVYLVGANSMENYRKIIRLIQSKLFETINKVVLVSEDNEIADEVTHDLLNQYSDEVKNKISIITTLDVLRNTVHHNHEAIDENAKFIHEVFATASGQDQAKPWELVDEKYRESNRYVYHHLKLKQKYMELFSEKSKDQLVRELSHMEHNRWRNERTLDGFVYGPKRNDDLRINPNLVKWEELSTKGQESNINWIKGLLEAANLM